MHLSGLIFELATRKRILKQVKIYIKEKIDVIYQLSLRKHSAKAVSSGFFFGELIPHMRVV